MENEIRAAYCAKRTRVHKQALSEADEIHKVLDGGPSSATFERAKAITGFIQRFGTPVN
jgi:hypothetical protein